MAEGKLTLHDLDVIVRQTDDLPALSAAVAWVMEATDPELVAELGVAWALERAARAVAADAALAGRVIRLAGGVDGPAGSSIFSAVKALGVDVLRAAVLSNRVFEAALAGPANDEPSALVELWRCNLTAALACRILAELAGMRDRRDEAYLAGLMHDAGVLVLRGSVPKSYARAAAGCEGPMVPPDREKHFIGADHLAAGRRLAQHWRLGPAVGGAAWLHHMPGEAIPDSAPGADLARLAALADAMARMDAREDEPATAAQMRALRLTEDDMDEAARRIDEELAQHADLLSLADGGAPGAGGDWLRRANTELGRLGMRLGLGRGPLAARADAMTELTEFAAGISAEAGLPDVLCQIAGRFAGSGPALAYSLDDRAAAMLAVRVSQPGCHETADAPPQWRSFALAPGWRQLSAPGLAVTPCEVLSRLLGSVDGLAGWMDLDYHLHLPLVSGGKWVGGVICPAEAGCQERIAPPLALVLGLVQQRSLAEAVGEELAGASQLLSAAREEIDEARLFRVVGDLAAGAGHELNTPLAIVSGRAQLMRAKAQDPEQRRTWDLIAEQAQRISDIISELMDFAAPASPRPVAFSAGSALSESVQAFSCSDHPQAGSCKVDIEVEDGLPLVSADAGQLRTVLTALLENAACAAGDDGRVVLSASTDAGRKSVLLRVADDGPGMNGDTLSRVWTPFFSLHKAGRRRGLGLAKAKRYTEANGGRIWIDSEPGSGTVVSVQLPAAETPREGEARHGDQQDGPSIGGG